MEPELKTRNRNGMVALNGFILRPYLPEQSVEYIFRWFESNRVRLRISRNRTSKLGDYRPSRHNIPARISVNNNLNPYDFLITLVHEMAHHEVWKQYLASQPAGMLSFMHRPRRQTRPKPHGNEWQQNFRELIDPLMNTAVFPADVLYMLENYFRNLKLSAKFGQDLARILKRYDQADGREFVESLPFDAVFSLPDGRTFRRKEKLRKRYRCICLSNNRVYLFNPLAQVFQQEK
jgi:SprT protein